MRDEQLEAGVALEHAGEDQPRHGNRCLDGKADTERQYGAETAELVDRHRIVWMDENRQAGS